MKLGLSLILHAAACGQTEPNKGQGQGGKDGGQIERERESKGPRKRRFGT